ncbi:hypothetical protein, partial [Photorhabdus aegyptia]|uniref:hypothetical protein n=1 Tax=Photorhabdus aegyptia TaxID=2805098 RepID=UPI001E49C225
KKQFYKIMVIESVINEALYLIQSLSYILNIFILLNLVNNMFLFLWLFLLFDNIFFFGKIGNYTLFW